MRIAILTLLALPATALAEGSPAFEVIDRGTAVEVIAHDVTAAKTAITPIRSRLEVPLVGHPRADKVIPGDATVKLVEFDGNEQRVLSVKTGFERADVKNLAKYAQAIQVGSDVHVLFPRIVPADGSSIVLPEPTLPPALAAKLAAPAPVAETKPVAAENVPAAEKAPAPDAKPAAATTATTKPAPAITSATPPTPAPATLAPATMGPPKEDAWQKLSMYGAAGLAAIGCGVWLLRRRKAQQGAFSSIDVIAQKSLGAKAKVVWFTAGGREMVVAVTPQQVRMLGQWKKAAGTDNVSYTALPAAHTYAEAAREARPETRASSAAVEGIRKLRERRSHRNMLAPAVNEEVATDDADADEVWAKEILAATGARR